MEMPTPCEKCGGIFELLDGLTSEKWFPSIIICEPCGQEEEAEVERDEEISALKEQVGDALYTLNSANKRLAELGEKSEPTVTLPRQLIESASAQIAAVADRINDAINEEDEIAGSTTVDPLMRVHGELLAALE
jgi:hypothetical protein